MNFNNSRNILITLLLCSILVLTACNGCNNNKYSQRETIKADKYPLKLERFDKDLFNADTNNLTQSLTKLAITYGQFYQSYANDVMQMPVIDNDTIFTKPMRMLLSIPRIRELAKIVDSNFADISDIENSLAEAMGVYHKTFPQNTVPRFVTFISEFGNGNIIYDSMICIGLDFYMNKRFGDFYRGLKLPEFMINKMQRNYIVPNTLKALAISLTDYQTTRDKRFLAQMIVEGKIRYFIKALQPNISDTLIMGYSTSQLFWCEKNELDIWKHFIDKNMLYESEPGKFMRYLNDGPFTVAEDVPKESSPAIGAWTGWQIVNHYMHNNPNVSLKQMMDETDFEKILKQSRYRPQ